MDWARAPVGRVRSSKCDGILTPAAGQSRARQRRRSIATAPSPARLAKPVHAAAGKGMAVADALGGADEVSIAAERYGGAVSAGSLDQTNAGVSSVAGAKSETEFGATRGAGVSSSLSVVELSSSSLADTGHADIARHVTAVPATIAQIIIRRIRHLLGPPSDATTPGVAAALHFLSHERGSRVMPGHDCPPFDVLHPQGPERDFAVALSDPAGAA
jgi:hypothetical protein